MRKWIEITTYLPCPQNCAYCPQKLLNSQYKGKQKLSLVDFKKILKNIPDDVEIHFSGFSEPAFHPDFESMAISAKETHIVNIYSSVIEGFDDIFTVHNEKNSVQNPISRAGNNWETETRQGAQCVRSPSFEQNVMLPNGDVYLCCMDYGLKHKLGNLFKTNFNNLNRTHSYKLCEKCESFI